MYTAYLPKYRRARARKMEGGSSQKLVYVLFITSEADSLCNHTTKNAVILRQEFINQFRQNKFSFFSSVAPEVFTSSEKYIKIF